MTHFGGKRMRWYRFVFTTAYR